MEIVAYPPLIFLDEPTSGLDSATTQVIMKVLKALRKKNISIVAGKSYFTSWHPKKSAN